MEPRRRGDVATVLIAIGMLVEACSDEPRRAAGPKAGADASGGAGVNAASGDGTAGLPASGTRGGTAGTGGNAGSASAGTGGGPGTAGIGGATAAPPKDFGPNDVDLSLGGLNQDLPAPPGDCLQSQPQEYVCFAANAVIGGVARTFVCTALSTVSLPGDSFSCRTAAGEIFEIHVGKFTSIPGTFSLSEDTVPGSILLLDRQQDRLSPRSNNFKQARVAGWVNVWNDNGKMRNSVWGTLAASWAEDTDAGIAETRIRASFHVRNF
jgi:hypothetical protein